MAIKRAPEIGRVPGAVVVRSDVERKRLAGIPLEQHMPRGSYTPEASGKVYAAMIERARQALRAGHSAILDAVFARPEERQMAEGVGDVVECEQAVLAMHVGGSVDGAPLRRRQLGKTISAESAAGSEYSP